MADVELPLTGHLAELRRRLAISIAAIAVTFAVCYPESAYLFHFLELPLHSSASTNGLEYHLVGTGIGEGFFMKIGVAFFGSIVLALPVILFQLWRFIAPGLETHEARYAKWFVLFGTIFFLVGATFCYEFFFPVAFPFFLAEYADIGIEPMLRISEYLSFTSRMLLAFGATFELPVVIFFLARTGLVTWRQLLGFSRYAVLVIFIVAAVLTPTPDAASQLMMAVPLLVLYAISIVVAYLFGRAPAVSDDDDVEGGEPA